MGHKHSRPAVPPPLYEAYSADDPTPLRVDFALYGAIGGAHNVTAEALAAHALGGPYASPASDLYVWRVATHAGAVAVEGPLRLLPQPALLDPLLPILLVLAGVQPERLADATPAVRQAVLRGEATLHVSNAALGGDPHVGTAKQLLLCATRRGTHQTVVLGPVPEGQRLPLAPLRALGLLGGTGEEGADAALREYLRVQWSIGPLAPAAEEAAAGAAAGGGAAAAPAASGAEGALAGSALPSSPRLPPLPPTPLLLAPPLPPLPPPQQQQQPAAEAEQPLAAHASASASEAELEWCAPSPGASSFALSDPLHAALPLALVASFEIPQRIDAMQCAWYDPSRTLLQKAAAHFAKPDLNTVLAHELGPRIRVEVDAVGREGGAVRAVRVRLNGCAPPLTLRL